MMQLHNALLPLRQIARLGVSLRRLQGAHTQTQLSSLTLGSQVLLRRMVPERPQPIQIVCGEAVLPQRTVSGIHPFKGSILLLQGLPPESGVAHRLNSKGQ
eukprot:2555007-Amphidinium_carterae.1